MFKKNASLILFQFVLLTFTQMGSAQLTRVEGESHRFQYINGHESVDINLDPGIGAVRYIAAVRLTTHTRFYIQTDERGYLYSESYVVNTPSVMTMMRRSPADSIGGHYIHCIFPVEGASTVPHAPVVVFRGATNGLDPDLSQINWLNLEVDEMERVQTEDQQLMRIKIDNPVSQPQVNWLTLNSLYSGEYTVLEELSLH